jgi:hypothetical protein
MSDIIKKGDKFYAIVKKGDHSKTLDGVEGAGRKLGPFVCTLVKPTLIECETHRFYNTDFTFQRS